MTQINDIKVFAMGARSVHAAQSIQGSRGAGEVEADPLRNPWRSKAVVQKVETVIENVKQAADAGAAAATGLAWFGYLPEVAAGLAILWYLLRLWEWIRAKQGKANILDKM